MHHSNKPNSLRAPVTPMLNDLNAERVRREHELKILELQGRPASRMEVISGVQLADGVATPVAHKLGRAPKWVSPSPPPVAQHRPAGSRRSGTERSTLPKSSC